MSKTLIITGHSGAGKDAVSDKLKGHYASITPYTTRAIRDGEVEGNPYYFVDKTRFYQMIADEELIEYQSYVTQFNGVEDTAFYGTGFASIPKEPSMITIGVNAAVELKAKLGDDAVLVYLHVDDDTRQERAKSRGSFDQTEWDNRLAQDHERFRNGLPTEIDITINNMQPLKATVFQIEEYMEPTTSC